MSALKTSLQDLLSKNAWLLNGWAVFAAFSTYFSMYMFRKPFTAASFSEATSGDWDQKTVIVSSQVMGYMISKIIGVRVISALEPGKRAFALIALIVSAHLALLLFAILPAPLHIVAIFLNGLPLGMVFGLVMGFLEGRRMTEALMAGLCVSFIVAGGFAKTLGRVVLDTLTESMEFSLASAERWMPFFAGIVFLLPLIFSVWMLVQVPPPDEKDIQQRSIRPPMSPTDRRRILQRYGVGVGAVTVVYFLVSILRSLRDDFAPEIFAGMGTPASAADYAIVDLAVGVIVMLVNGLSVLVRDNRTALLVSLTVCFTGFLLLIGSLLLTPLEMLSASGFMIMLGAGLYLPYVAVHTTIFERMIALTRDRSNLAFLMYVVDSLGYLGYVGVMLARNFMPTLEGDASVNFLISFRLICWISAIISIVGVGVAAIYFARLPVPKTVATGTLAAGDSISEQMQGDTL